MGRTYHRQRGGQCRKARRSHAPNHAFVPTPPDMRCAECGRVGYSTPWGWQHGAAPPA